MLQHSTSYTNFISLISLFLFIFLFLHFPSLINFSQSFLRFYCYSYSIYISNFKFWDVLLFIVIKVVIILKNNALFVIIFNKSCNFFFVCLFFFYFFLFFFIYLFERANYYLIQVDRIWPYINFKRQTQGPSFTNGLFIEKPSFSICSLHQKH